MKKAFEARLLPLSNDSIDYNYFLDELIDASAKLEVYKEKVSDSKLSSKWFLPTLQQIEVLESSKLEGTQATLDGVLMNQALPTDEDVNINEVVNYSNATKKGLYILNREKFSNEFFQEIHSVLMEGNVRKPKQIYGKDIAKRYPDCRSISIVKTDGKFRLDNSDDGRINTSYELITTEN